MTALARLEWKIENVKDIFKGRTNMRILKVFTCGNVDDGKSTLLGRLLLDSDSISVDILHQLTEQGGGVPNLALLTDGLRAERSMGITIDVAYKFFTTKHTKYILVDTPGHQEYTRNMYAGASECEVAIVLIDALKPIEAQTRKHLEIMEAIGIKHLIIAVNKMDAVRFDQTVFLERQTEVNAVLNPQENHRVHWIPISALTGENVVESTPSMPWYAGPTILECLESIPPRLDTHGTLPLLEIQGIYEGTAYGKVLQGTMDVKNTLYRGTQSLEIKECYVNGIPRAVASPGDQVALLGTNINMLKRGQQWGKEAPLQCSECTVELCWMGDAMEPGTMEFILRRGAAERIARVDLPIRINPNDIQHLTLNLSAPIDLLTDRIQTKKERIILIDKTTNATVAAGIIKQINQ
jgi:sulfate adenylyltransferase subunit 1